jgi:hypothetical protein
LKTFSEREKGESHHEEYRKGHYFTDFWNVYQLVIPEDQLTQVGDDSY